MKKLILIKLGGSLITDKSKPYTAKLAVIKRLAREIKTAWNKDLRFVIAHGGGSFPHTSAAKYKTADGIKKKADVFGLAVVQQDALKINRILNEIFLREGLPCLSFVPSSFTLAKKQKMVEIFINPIIQALKVGALPLVFGDIILDRKNGCCIFSGEKTLVNLIKPLTDAGFKIIKTIQCGVTNGVYDQQGKTTPFVTLNSFSSLDKIIDGAAGADVTGGMRHKIRECLKMANFGIDSFIINGKKKDELLKAILGKKVKGTLVTKNEPKKTRPS